MQLFQEELTLHVPNWGLRATVPSRLTSDVVYALRSLPADSSVLSVLMSEDNYYFSDRQTISADCRYILDCVGKTWVQDNKISSIKLLRKVFDCSLPDGKNAVEEYLA